MGTWGCLHCARYFLLKKCQKLKPSYTQRYRIWRTFRICHWFFLSTFYSDNIPKIPCASIFFHGYISSYILFSPFLLLSSLTFDDYPGEAKRSVNGLKCRRFPSHRIEVSKTAIDYGRFLFEKTYLKRTDRFSEIWWKMRT